MKAILERLFSLRGIRATAAFDKNGILLASHGDVLTPTLEQLASTFTATLGSSAFAVNSTNNVMRFESGVVVVRRNADVMLVVVGDATFDPSERGAAVPINGALIALRAGSRRPPRSTSMPAPSDSANPPSVGDLKPPKAPSI